MFELSLKIWLRSQIFFRILIKLKNSKIMKIKKSNSKNFSYCVKKFFTDYLWISLLKNVFSSAQEFLTLVILLKLFMSKLKGKKKKARKKFSFPEDKEIKKLKFPSFFRKKKKKKNFILNSLGKLIEFQGKISIIKELKTKILALLLECSECNSIFYCFFESCYVYKPFICVKTCCKSKTFISFDKKLSCIFWRKIRLQKDEKSGYKNFIFPILDIELVGGKIAGLKIGQNITISGILKIQKFKNNISRNQNILKNIFVLILKGQKIFPTPRKNKIFFLKNFLKKKEYRFFSSMKKVKNIFGICVKSLDFLIEGCEGFKAAIVCILGVGKLDLMFKPFFLGFISEEKFSKKKRLLAKLSVFFSTGFFVQQRYENFDSKFLSENKYGNFFLDSSQINPPFFPFQTLIDETKFSFDGWIICFHKFLKKLFPKKNIPNFIFLELRFKKKRLIHKDLVLSRKFLTWKDIWPVGFLFALHDKNLKNIKISKNYCPEKYLKNKKGLGAEKNSIYKLIKFRFSKYILKRFLKYIQIFNLPTLSDESNNFLLNLYIFSRRNFQNISLLIDFSFLESIILFSKIKTKIDLRSLVTKNDLIDCFEIFSESKPKFKKILRNYILREDEKLIKKIFFAKKILKLSQKLNLKEKKSVHHSGKFYEAFYEFLNRSEYDEIQIILQNYGIIRKIGENFFKILNF